LYVGNIGPLKDSGLSMCESIRDSKNPTGTASATDSSSSAKMTEAQYLELRAKFAKSRYADIRDSGTKFVDLIWQFSGATDDDALGALLLVGGQIVQAYSSLSGSCAAHGVVIPPLTEK